MSATASAAPHRDGPGQGQRGRGVEDVVDAAELHRGGGRDAVVLKVRVRRTHPAQHDVGVRLCGSRRHRAAGGGAHLVVVGEGAQQGVVEAEVDGPRGPCRGVSAIRATRGSSRFSTTVPVVLDAMCCSSCGGLVDLAEAVQLVAQDVEQEAVARRHLVDEVHGVGLVEFQHRDVGVQPAAPVHLAEQRGGHAAGEVAAGAVGEDLQALALQQLHHHLGGGGLAVRAADDGDAVGQRGQRPAHEAGVDFFDHEPGKGRASAPEPGDPADELAERNAEVKHAL